MDDKGVVAEIWNMTGQSIYRDVLHFAGGKTRLMIVNGTPGNYVLQLIDSKGAHFIFKFVINDK